MYLKSIDVQGFKSFANKMTFEFHNGITGIVGPNGSGKSNIGDAMRWVLGEQSAKQLRGGKMEDVIFAGTELRKPVNYASVAITIDNTDHALPIDYDQVTVTRKVYRSGESEYLINGSTCRLKDINELFYDTGIGKEGYSIIGQGQIDRILSGKAEERRELFDEAAGIVKFKRRKNEAKKKLEGESQSLVRINDILAELENQVGPLEKQSKKAKEYLELKEKLKKNEINLFIIESEEIKQKLAEFYARLEKTEEELENAQAEYEKSGKTYSENEDALNNLNRIIEENSKKHNEALLSKHKLSGEIALLNEQINSVKQNDEYLNNQLNTLKDKLEDKTEEKQRLVTNRFKMVDDLNDIKVQKEESDKELAALNIRINTLTESIDNFNTEIVENISSQSGVKAELQKNITLLEQINIRKAELTRKLIEYKSKEVIWKDNLDKNKSELDAVRSEIKEYEAKLTSCRNKITEINAQLEAANRENHTLNRIIMGEGSKLESLRNIAERYEGYGVSVKRVMELKDSNKGIVGVVADIIKTRQKYETAIETALGGSIQNIVTDNEETAKQLIEYLKKNKFGRATFLPLTAVSGNNIKEDKNLISEKGAIGYANTLVEVEEQYESLCKYLLGRILIVDNIDNAIAIARKYHHSVRIVTLEGDMLSPGGSMSGGSFKNNNNLLGRKRELEELEASLKENEKKLAVLNENISELKDTKNALMDETEEIKAFIQSRQIAENTSLMNYNQTVEQQELLSKERSNNNREAHEIERQIVQISADIEHCNKNVTESDERNKILSTNVEQYSKELAECKEALAQKQANAESLNLKYSGLKQQDSYAEENVKRILKEISSLNEEYESIKEGLSESEGKISEKMLQISELEKEIEAIVNAVASYESVDATEKDKREELKSIQKVLFTKREEMSKNVNILDKEVLKLTGAVEKIEEARDEKINYIWNEYELTLIMATELKDEEYNNPVELRKNIGSLKTGIRNLGSVNVNAIEEYEAVAERYTFMKAQHEDLTIAKENLIKIIEELDAGMRKQFSEKFQEIKVEFDKVFKELFGGGRGTIELEEDVDILEAGIRIISQPPGKKLQNMMQLSGGEKALTAISLLFAIQNLKPSPFCLLDEIEAALDDSNVARYAKYLHKLTKYTQFIVITHRRGTMSAADRLYGITMQEKGVSTLVSVDLIQDQLDEADKPKE